MFPVPESVGMTQAMWKYLKVPLMADSHSKSINFPQEIQSQWLNSGFLISVLVVIQPNNKTNTKKHPVYHLVIDE